MSERRVAQPVTLHEGEDRRIRIAVAALGLLLVALLVLLGLLFPATPPAADGGFGDQLLEVNATEAPVR